MKSASDPFDLKRFVYAQAPVYRSVVEELRAGRKRGHWMWFVFPQLRGLGSSPLAVRYKSVPIARTPALFSRGRPRSRCLGSSSGSR
ncbi:calpastatin [Mycobacterium tuberculosis]|nr:calpastatin [Mycobacterium tuberculosis]SGQ15938.1 calpastatin [Mycobacterium tuberculosis]